jgi:hypothetical protein
MLGRLEIDEARVRAELKRSNEFRYAEPYGEFLSGRAWKTCMLWSAGGEVGDNVLSHYDSTRPVHATEYGEQLPYLREIIEQRFSVKYLTFARIAVMAECVIFPHRDFVELDDVPKRSRAEHRLHVPLVTHEDAYFTEDNLVYQMKVGEVWFLDVTRVHSAAVLSENKRVHLILDFADAPDGERLTNFETDPAPGIPRHSIRGREPLTDRERLELRSLASIVDLDNLTEVFGILIKRHYRKDGGENFVWDTMFDVARRSGNAAVESRVRELHEHCVAKRAE